MPKKIKKQKNILEEKYGTQKRWVNYRAIPNAGRITKIPFSPITKRNASSMKESDWGTYDQAIAFNPENIGIVFTSDKTLLGIDIDHCLEGSEIVHEDKEKIVQLIIEADSYTEISPSGTGLHIYIALTGGLDLSANRHKNFEAYTSGRYFTSTGTSYKDAKAIRTCTPEEALDLLAIIGYPWKEESAPAQSQLTTGAPAIVNQLSTGDDAQLLKRIYASKGGIKIKKLYEGDASAYKDDLSTADMALLAHLAFWTGRDAVRMERIWLASVLGQREKTQKRGDYRKRSISAAIKNCKEVHETTSSKVEAQMKADAPELDFLFQMYRGEKIYTQNTENMCRILRFHPDFKDGFRHDIFKNVFETIDVTKKQWRDLEDNDAVNVQTAIQILFPCFAKVGKEMIYDAIIKVSRENAIDSATDWLQSLVWDGEKRLDSWLSKTFNVSEDTYHTAVGANWMKGLVKRIIEPGCKFDYVLVLEGEQGIKKSTSLAILGGAWHLETTMSTDNKDFFMQFQGKAIVEFSEGETFSRTEVKRMKAIITMQSDKYRPAYGRMSIDFPRRCVFAMTTNQEEYLKDETGNRRWLPVACKGIANVEWLAENRAQLYAEAYQRVIVDRESTWEFPFEETRRMQELRQIHDPNEDLIVHWYFNKLKQTDRDAGVTVNQAFREAICANMPGRSLDRFNEMAIAKVFKSVIRLDRDRRMNDGVRSYRWYQMETSMQKALPIPEDDVHDVAF